MSRAQTLAKARAQTRRGTKREARQDTGQSLTGGRLKALLGVVLAAATIALYMPVGGQSFVVFDDRDYVTANPYVQSGLSWNTIKWAFTSTSAANWHPLTWLSHALDCQLFGLNAAGHHLDSVLIHVAQCSAVIPIACLDYQACRAKSAGGRAVAPCIRLTWSRWRGLPSARMCLAPCLCFWRSVRMRGMSRNGIGGDICW